MKTADKAIIALTLLAAAIMTGAPPSWAFTPGTGFVGSQHAFSTITTDSTTSPSTKVTIGVCAKCHTPHKAIKSQLLWNHTLSTNTFSWDAPATTAGTTYPTFKGDTYKGPTAKCLSCHDGSVSTSDIAWFNGAKPTIVGFKASTAFGHITVGLGGHLGMAPGVTGGTSGGATHPVAMPYPYLQAKSTYNFVTTGGAYIKNEWVGDPTAVGIRLFTDDGAGNIVAGTTSGQTGIECMSCHDVHNGVNTVDEPLLRGKLTGNDSTYLCNKCHIKDQ